MILFMLIMRDEPHHLRYTPHSISDILGVGNEDQSSTSSEKGKTGTNIMENPLNLSLHEGFQTWPLNIFIFLDEIF